jgi:hypothetical protein
MRNHKGTTKNVNKNWLGSRNVPGKHLYIDISSINERRLGETKLQAIIINDYTDYSWNFVMKKKLDLRGKIRFYCLI